MVRGDEVPPSLTNDSRSHRNGTRPFTEVKLVGSVVIGVTVVDLGHSG